MNLIFTVFIAAVMLVVAGVIAFFREKPHDRTKDLESSIRSLFDKIKHGDQEHQDWLQNEIKEHFKDVIDL